MFKCVISTVPAIGRAHLYNIFWLSLEYPPPGRVFMSLREGKGNTQAFKKKLVTTNYL